MTWHPAVREPDPLMTLVREAARSHLFPGEPGSTVFAAVRGESWREAILPDGTVVRADLKASPASRRRRGPRACAGIRVAGVLALGRQGHRVEADILIDLATRAILSCEARIESL